MDWVGSRIHLSGRVTKTMNRKLSTGIGLILAGVILGGWTVSTRFSASAGLPLSVDGDVNGDGALNLGDPVHLLRYLFQGGPAPVPCPAAPPLVPASMVLVVRHAEKAPGADTDGGPHLNDAGKLQAQLLKEALKDLPIDFIAASTLIRTQETVQPVAERNASSPIVIEQFGDTSNYTGLIEFIESRPPGTTTLVAHHSPTLHNILKDLGAPASVVDDLIFSGNNYNNMVVLFLQPGVPTLALPLRGQDPAAFPVLHISAPR